MGSSPISGSCFLLRFLRSFCRVFLGFFLLLFCPQRFSASGSLPFFCHSLPFSHLCFLLPHTSCTPHLSDLFVSAHQSSVFIPRSGTPASASGANVVSPCSSPHLAPFAPSRLPCCLGPSPALLSASLLNSLSPSLSSSPYLPFFSAPVLLSSSPSSPPPGVYQCLARQSAKLAFPHV